jgi:hypothetical protein
MDLEETVARNDCAGEGQQQFNRSTDSLQNKVLRTTGNFPRCAYVRDLHTAFNLPYVYDYIKKLCRRQAEVMQNHGMAMCAA